MTRLLADSTLGTTAVFGVHREIEVLLLIIFYIKKKKVLCSSEIWGCVSG
jgi:hypothetical protein